MVSSGTRSRSAGERVRLFSATWAGVKSRQGPAVQQLPVRGVGRAGRVELGPAAKTGVAQALRLQLGQLGAVEGKALALVVGSVGAAFLPTWSQKRPKASKSRWACKTYSCRVRSRSKSSLRRMMSPPWDLAASQAIREQKQIAQMQIPAGRGGKPPHHTRHSISPFHWLRL